MSITKSYPIPHCTRFESDTPGNHLLIVAGQHGNEQIGCSAAINLVNHLSKVQEMKGAVTVVTHANEQACDRKKRQVLFDMNRLFTGSTILGIRKKAGNGQHVSYEEIRASNIAKLADEADGVIDTHSTSAPSPSGFVVCAKYKNHIDIASLLHNTSHIVIDPTGNDGTLDQYVSKKGGIGLTYETGQRNQKCVEVSNDELLQRELFGPKDDGQVSIESVVVQNYKELLASADIAFQDQALPRTEDAHKILELTGKHVVDDSFRVPWHATEPRTAINLDKTTVHASRVVSDGKLDDAYIIFPNREAKHGEVSFEYARALAAKEIESIPKKYKPITRDEIT